MGYLTEEKFDRFSEENSRVLAGIQSTVAAVEETVEKIYRLLDRESRRMEENERDAVSAHARIDRIETHIGLSVQG